jgi:hypothetical protein
MSQYFLQVWRCQDGILRTSVEPNEKDILDPPQEWGEIDLVSSTLLPFGQRGLFGGDDKSANFDEILNSTIDLMNASGHGFGTSIIQHILQIVSVATLKEVRKVDPFAC